MKTFLKTISLIFMIIFFVFSLSCSNNLTNSGNGVDKKYAGTYSGEITKKYPNGSITTGMATYTVNDNGSISGLITYDVSSSSDKVELSKERIVKISDNSYKAEPNFTVPKKYTFTFNDKIMELNIDDSEDNSVISANLINSK